MNPDDHGSDAEGAGGYSTNIVVREYRLMEQLHGGPAREWFQALRAPDKRLMVVDTSGHRPLFERPELFATVMTDTVLTRTRPPGR